MIKLVTGPGQNNAEGHVACLTGEWSAFEFVGSKIQHFAFESDVD